MITKYFGMHYKLKIGKVTHSKIWMTAELHDTVGNSEDGKKSIMLEF